MHNWVKMILGIVMFLCLWFQSSQVAASDDTARLTTLKRFREVYLPWETIDSLGKSLGSPNLDSNSVVFPDGATRFSFFPFSRCLESDSARDPLTCTMTCDDPANLISGFELSSD